MSFKLPPLPPRLTKRPRDRRGLPIPANVMIRDDGTPDFRVTDPYKAVELLRSRSCALCGQPLDLAGKRRGAWMIGGPGAAFEPNGAYLDGPVHYECGQWALQVCPFLAIPRYTEHSDPETVRTDPGTILAINTAMQPGKPDYFVFAQTRGYQTQPTHEGLGFVIIPVRPLIGFECWKDGRRIPRP